MKNKIVILFACLSLGISAWAETNTFYFMDEVPMRNSMNPAFIPNTRVYVDFIVMPSLSLNVGENAYALKDIFLNKNGQTISALHPSLNTVANPDQNVDNLYKRLWKSFAFETDFNINILEFGWRIQQKNYLSFRLGLNVDADVFLARDIFKLAYYGTPNPDGDNLFKLRRTGLDLAVYADLSANYSYRIDNQWTVGGRIGFLAGFVGATTKAKKLNLNATRDSWDFDADMDIYAAMPIQFNTNEDGTVDFGSASVNNFVDFAKPSGYGASIDLGFTYEPIRNLVVAGSITDLGFIYWYNNTLSGHAQGVYSFTGIHYEPGDSINLAQIGEDALSAFQISSKNDKGFAQMLHGNFNASIEYGVLKNKISFGLLSHFQFNPQRTTEEVTLAANFRPLDWLKAYFTYSFVSSRWNNMGLGLSLRLGPINMYLAADYIPLSWAKTTFSSGGSEIPLPYGTERFNLQMGMNLNIGRDSGDKDRDGVKNIDDQCPNTPIRLLRKLCPDVKRKMFVDSIGCMYDEDGDGVPDCYDQCPGTPFGEPVDSVGCPYDDDADGVYNYEDECPNTPVGVMVDIHGCPLDDDHDGVPNYLDKCPDTAEGIQVDEHGCPLDSDGDGVTDDLDKCPNTPKGVTVDADGCPLDSDKDGVADHLDLCPNTPIGAIVDENGCPIDSDHDGVYDYLDKCPNTPEGVMVDENGCPLDSDKDGVADYLDKCPNTPEGARVDADGCPLDSDGDGVPDYLDNCPNTPAEAYETIDECGCPRDADGDGVPDYLDKCPAVPGEKNNQGCPELKREVRNLFKKAMQGIQFETGKDVILAKSFPILDDIVNVMFENPNFLLTINGHTDNVGNDEANMVLSEKRAAAVLRYLTGKGVEAERLTSNGYGETLPIADNNTKAGRAQNRRVEFIVSYEEVTYEKVVNPELQDQQ